MPRLEILLRRCKGGAIAKSFAAPVSTGGSWENKAQAIAAGIARNAAAAAPLVVAPAITAEAAELRARTGSSNAPISTATRHSAGTHAWDRRKPSWHADGKHRGAALPFPVLLTFPRAVPDRRGCCAPEPMRGYADHVSMSMVRSRAVPAGSSVAPEGTALRAAASKPPPTRDV